MPIPTSGNDSLTGTAWNDSISGLAGNDTLHGNDGNDELFGGAGTDSLYGGNGTDALSGGTGSDMLDGGAGADNLVGGQGVDTIYAGGGNDIIVGDGQWLTQSSFASGILGFGTTLTVINTADGPIHLEWIDTLGHSHPVATIAAGQTYAFSTLTSNNYMLKDANGYYLEPITGASNQVVTYGPNLSDLIYGGANDDVMLGQYGNDTLHGDDGNDQIEGGTGNDSILGGLGKDTLSGGDGADRLAGGAGNDAVFGGAGRDVFDFDAAGGHDIVGDFDMSLQSGTTADQLDVADLQNADGSPVRSWDVVVSDDGSGQAVLSFPGGESVRLSGVSPAQAAQTGMLHAMGVPCFAAGTRILTPDGERRVEDIAVGDLVSTTTGQALAVLWHGWRLVEDLPLKPQQQPIRLAAGGFGNRRDLLLSPQHGVYLARAGGLIRAKHLVGLHPRARVAQGMHSVTYHHLLLPAHALLWAEGAAAESFYPGPVALAALSGADRQRVAAAISATSGRVGLGQSLALLYGPRCLPLLNRQAAAKSLGIAKKVVLPCCDARRPYWESVSAKLSG